MHARLTLVIDALLAVAVTAAGVAEIWVPFGSRQGSGSAWLTTAAVVAAGVCLAARRQQPLSAGLVVLLMWPALDTVGDFYVLFFGQFVAMAIALFSMARHGADRVPYLGAVAAATTLILVDLTVEELQSPGEVFFHWMVFTVVWVLGFAMRQADARARESTKRAVVAELAAVQAAAEERSRIARELHDIVAHAVSVMVVQAGSAEQVVDEDSAYVRRALATIRQTGTGALDEMRRVVAMLRDPDEPGPLSPQPGVDALGPLLEDARAAGLVATYDVIGEPRPLPAGVDLAAYRIVQEALTNVRRHASASSVQVRLCYADSDLCIEVVDDGTGTRATDRVPAGHGLVGMRERAALYGGSLETASDGTGFTVRARLPVGATT